MTRHDLLIRQRLQNGGKADILYFLDESKIAEEERYDGLYAVCTDLFDDDPAHLLKVSEGRWQIEACFRIMKTDFEARPVYVRREDRTGSLSDLFSIAFSLPLIRKKAGWNIHLL